MQTSLPPAPCWLLRLALPAGLFALLNEQCMLGKGNDAAFAAAALRTHAKHPSFLKAGPASPFRGKATDFAVRCATVSLRLLP